MEITKNAWVDKILESVSAQLQQELSGLRGFQVLTSGKLEYSIKPGSNPSKFARQ